MSGLPPGVRLLDDACPVCGRAFEVGEEVHVIATITTDRSIKPTNIAMHKECARTAFPDAPRVEPDPGQVQ